MKKIIVIVLVILGVLQAILWSFDILRFYNYPTVANEPNLKQDAKFIWSKLVEPKRMDFICFKATDTYLGDYESAMRLVGVPNDVLEIKSGDLYVNNKRIDKNIDLRRLYKSEKKYFIDKIQPLVKEESFERLMWMEDSIAFFLDDSFVNKENIVLERQIESRNNIDSSISSMYNEDWNKDNFGPITIPKNMYFVMGDNRENSIDSRCLGLVSKEDILGTIIYIYQ